MRVFQIYGEISLRGTKGVQAQLRAFSRSASDNVARLQHGFEELALKAAVAFDTLNDKVQEHSETIQAAGAVLAGTGAAATAALGFAAKTGAEFDTQFRTVRGIAQATDEQFLKLKRTARDLGAVTSFTATQAGEGFEHLSRQGFKAWEQIRMLPPVLSLAEADSVDLGESARITGVILKGFGKHADETERIVDGLHNTAANANTNVQDLGIAFSYAAPLAKQAQISFEDTATAIGIMGDGAIEGSRAGTSLAGAITRLLNPSKESLKALQRLGIQIRDDRGQFVGLRSLIDQLGRSQRRTGNDTEFAALAMEVFGQRAGPAMLTLVDQGVEAFDRLRAKVGETGTTAAVAEERMGGLGGSFKRLSSAVAELQIAITESGFGDFLKGVIDLAAQAILWLSRLHPTLLGVGSVVTAVGGTIATFAGATLLALPTLTRLLASLGTAAAGGSTAASALSVALRGLGLAVRSLMGPLGLAIVAIGTLISLGIAEAFRNAARSAGGFADELDRIARSGEASTSKLEALEALLERQQSRLRQLERLEAAAGGHRKRNLQESIRQHREAIALTERRIWLERKAVEGLADAQARQAMLEQTRATDSLGASLARLGDSAQEGTERARFNLREWLDELKRFDRELKQFVERDRERMLAVQAATAPPVIAGGQIPTLPTGTVSTGDQPALGMTHREREAYARAGAATRSDLERTVAQAQKDYELIRDSGETTAGAVEAAWRRSLEAQVRYFRALGDDMTDEQRATLRDLETDLRKFGGGHGQQGVLGWLRIQAERVGESLSRAFDIGGELSELIFGPLQDLGGAMQGIARVAAGLLDQLIGTATQWAVSLLLPDKGKTKAALKTFFAWLGGAMRKLGAVLWDFLLDAPKHIARALSTLARFVARVAEFATTRIAPAIWDWITASAKHVANAVTAMASLVARAVKFAATRIAPAVWDWVSTGVRHVGRLIVQWGALIAKRAAWLAVRIASTIWDWVSAGAKEIAKLILQFAALIAKAAAWLAVRIASTIWDWVSAGIALFGDLIKKIKLATAALVGQKGLQFALEAVGSKGRRGEIPMPGGSGAPGGLAGTGAAIGGAFGPLGSMIGAAVGGAAEFLIGAIQGRTTNDRLSLVTQHLAAIEVRMDQTSAGLFEWLSSIRQWIENVRTAANNVAERITVRTAHLVTELRPHLAAAEADLSAISAALAPEGPLAMRLDASQQALAGLAGGLTRIESAIRANTSSLSSAIRAIDVRPVVNVTTPTRTIYRDRTEDPVEAISRALAKNSSAGRGVYRS